MAPLKAPGPDGMSHLFYQHYWNLVGDDVCQSVLNFLNNASLPGHLNHTLSPLFPRKRTQNMPLNLDPLVSTMFYTRFSQKFWQID